MSLSVNSYQICWKVAIRSRQKGILDTKKAFRMIKNPWYGWAADPFLFEKDGIVYIFAEIWNYFRQRGSIAYCKLQAGKREKWKIIISEWHHLSYPFIWEDEKGIHICAETSETKKVYSYCAIDFPNKWIKEKIIIENARCADNTILFKDNQPDYLFTYIIEGVNKGKLYRVKLNENLEVIGDLELITEEAKLARPGGSFVLEDGNLFRVGQNCSESYGESLFFCKAFEKDGTYIEEESFERRYEDIVTTEPMMNCIGMHTYNRSNKFEIIDFRIVQFNIWNFLGYKLITFCNFIGRNALRILHIDWTNLKGQI